MKTTSLRARALACVLLTGTACCGLAAEPAAAQASPTYRNLDSNGVDLVRGDFLTSFVEGSIGSGEAELALLRMVGAIGGANSSGSQWDNILLNVDSTGATVDFGSRNDRFPGAESRGSTLSGSGSSYQYRAPEGTVIAFTDPTTRSGDVNNFCGSSGMRPSCILLPTSITSANGKTITLEYEFWEVCTYGPSISDPPDCTHTPRLLHVSNSYGYRISFGYATQNQGGGTSPPADFNRRADAGFRNLLTGSGAGGAVIYTYPSPGVTAIKDSGGRTWQVTKSSIGYSIRRPGAASDTLSATVSNGIVTSVVNEGVATQYSRSVWGNNAAGNSHATMTVTQMVPGGTSPVSTIVSDLALGRPISVTDPLSRTTAYEYDPAGRLKRVIEPEGNYVEHSYDVRGNVTRTVAVPKGGAGPTIVTSAEYDPTCANPKTCNQPNKVTDARGNVTEYEYGSNHGGVVKVTLPAPTPGAVQPQTRYGYTLVSGEYRPTEISQCRTTSACAGTADEVKTVFAYDGNGNLYWTAAGDGATLVAATAMTYDAVGNLQTVDGPLPGTADTSRIRYNSARQVEGTVSPDPDGSGPLRPRAVRNTYVDGLLTKVEQGNVASPSNLDWYGFSPAQSVETVHDAYARPEKVKATAGSAVYALTQVSYDALGRPECSARRMNPAEYESLPASACALDTEGGDGPDRIAKTVYDLAGQVTRVKTALGTADEADEVSTTYTANGQVKTVTDAENNRTTYEYDGHDRLSATRYPDPAKGAGTSSTTDFEQKTYESLAGGARTSGLVAAFRNRAGEIVGFGYDALGRQVSKDRPGAEPDVAYGYDLLGRMTSASQAGSAFAFVHDSLGRQLSETGPRGTVASEYDPAGRRTRIVYPDGFFVDQDHLVTGELARIRENGATSGIGVLATFGYDDQGRRTSLTRGNGTVTSYGYDAVSRLAALGQDLAGTAHDLTLGFAYNPASQIAAHTRSNDAYAWLGHGGGTTASAANGLNQIAVHGGVALGHDARGNLTSDPTIGRTYGYSSENLLVSVGLSGTLTGTLAYDPLMRLYEAGVNVKTRSFTTATAASPNIPEPPTRPTPASSTAPASTSPWSNIRARASPPAAGSTPTNAARSSPAPTTRAISPTSTRSTSRASSARPTPAASTSPASPTKASPTSITHEPGCGTRGWAGSTSLIRSAMMME